MKKKSGNFIKLGISVVIVCLFLWFLVISPLVTFKAGEKKMLNGAKDYFEMYSNELPTGERVKTLSLSTLYTKSFIKGDIYAPYSNNVCDLEESFVKVRKNSSGEYDYIVYLDCGILKSTVDHEGPTIKLNGDEQITIGVDEEFKDPGVDSLVDNKDGKLDKKNVTITGKVDTSKIGTYEIKYTAFDSLKNKTEVIRTVNVIKQIKSVVKKDLGKATNYTGEPENNYVRLSNMVFRIYGIDDNNNVKLVSAEDISFVNYSKLEDWLDYYYDNLNDKTKKMIVKAKYCNMGITDTTLDTTECSGYTKNIKVYIPSVIEVNKADDGSGNFMKGDTISWVSNTNGKNAYVTRSIFYGDDFGKSYISYSKNSINAVKPMFTIKGDSNVVSGTGSKDDPYTFNDYNKVKSGNNLNEAEVGQYIEIQDDIYRIISIDGDVTKVISNDTVSFSGEMVSLYPSTTLTSYVYNPRKKGNIGYYYNNRVSSYIDTSYFTNHDIKVPIYKDNIVYKNEVKTNTYSVKVFAPDMFELFSSQSNLYGHNSHSYWLLNSSNNNKKAAFVTDIGVAGVEEIEGYTSFGFRPVAYVKKNTVVTSGNGTYEVPYKLS